MNEQDEVAKLLCIQVALHHVAGSQPPSGYVDRHDWARVQSKAGLKQTRCKKCKLMHFPQEYPCNAA